MSGRWVDTLVVYAGNTCLSSTYALDPKKPNGHQIPFNKR